KRRTARQIRQARSGLERWPRIPRFASDPPPEGTRIRTCMGLFLSSVVFVWRRFFVRSGKAVLRPVACDQVRGARGRGQGTETVAKLGGLPPSDACVLQRLDA